MILVVGGAYQGKRDYAVQTLGCGADQIVEHAERIIRGWLDSGQDVQAALRAAMSEWSGKAVLLEDISCGVVPLDARDRAWIEAVGRCGASLAREADRVVRVFCGIGTVLKDA